MDQVVDPPSIHRTGPANNTMDKVSFFQKQFRKIRTVLPGNSGYEGFFQIDDKLKKTNESFESIKAKFNMRIFELINQ